MRGGVSSVRQDWSPTKAGIIGSPQEMGNKEEIIQQGKEEKCYMTLDIFEVKASTPESRKERGGGNAIFNGNRKGGQEGPTTW